MKILFYDAKQYDIDSFERERKNYPDLIIEYLDTDITMKTATLASGFDAICAFVGSDLNGEVIEKLSKLGIRLILLRCAGYNNVDIEKAKTLNITILRVPGYSPEAVAEHAMTLAMCVNRHIHKEYIKVRENNFSLVGLMGINMFGRIAGIIGTGKIGTAMAHICKGFGMKVIAYDKYPNKSLDFIEYKTLDEVLSEADLISLHCPLTDENYHMINKQSISMMKDDVILVNTSRGGLINTEELIHGIRSHKFHGVGLDVYEEENNNIFENREGDIMESSITARLLSFPNVIVTSHQAFFTEEALNAISKTTLENALGYENNNIDEKNIV